MGLDCRLIATCLEKQMIINIKHNIMDSKTFNSKKYGKVTVFSIPKRTARLFQTKINVTKDEAQIIQQQMNYHPAGYNFYDYKSDINGTSWKCWLSCD